MRTAVNIEVSIATTRTMRIETTGLASQKPAWARLLAATNPTMVPAMNTSPWAKLMKPSTPKTME